MKDLVNWIVDCQALFSKDQFSICNWPPEVSGEVSYVMQQPLERILLRDFSKSKGHGFDSWYLFKKVF